MILSAHQPAYLPWLGYFDRIRRSDIFVFLDAVQFEKNSFINRNKIKTSRGPEWLTVPIKGKDHLQSTMMETKVDSLRDLRSKHLRSIAQNYARAPLFSQQYGRLETLYQTADELIAELCLRHLKFWLAELKITTRIVRLSELPVTSRKSDLVFDLCLHFNADHYLSGALGRDYLDEARFASSGIGVSYQSFTAKPYPQLYGSFVPNLSIVDAWMNMGGDTVHLL